MLAIHSVIPVRRGLPPRQSIHDGNALWNNWMDLLAGRERDRELAAAE